MDISLCLSSNGIVDSVMGNGSLSKRKPRLVQSPSCERNASVLTPPISVEPASLQESK